MYSYLLPIGSVIRLVNNGPLVMIYGVRQLASRADQEKKIEKDYIGVPYPMGRLTDAYRYLFDHGDIQEVVFRGYDSPIRESFLKSLEEAAQKRAERSEEQNNAEQEPEIK